MEMNFRLYALQVGPIRTNCYLIVHEDTQEIIVVDPGDEAERILDKCRELGGEVKAIFLTHGHWDHTNGVKGLKTSLPEVKVYAGAKECAMLRTPSLNAGHGGVADEIEPDVTVEDGEVLSVIGLDFKVLETPGHTAGSVCYYMEKDGVLFAGDTLFRGSYGRTDLPTGDEAAIRKSLRRLADELPDDVSVLSGHGPTSTMAFEKAHNPAL
ncbi:MAG: MBL fold metallo-hydrolase [Lachnospiraceae bacterium]|nr:MBL fold metallo-hydrolase [Lachnospiraceae bacterium]